MQNRIRADLDAGIIALQFIAQRLIKQPGLFGAETVPLFRILPDKLFRFQFLRRQLAEAEECVQTLRAITHDTEVRLNINIQEH